MGITTAVIVYDGPANAGIVLELFGLDVRQVLAGVNLIIAYDWLRRFSLQYWGAVTALHSLGMLALLCSSLICGGIVWWMS